MPDQKTTWGRIGLWAARITAIVLPAIATAYVSYHEASQQSNFAKVQAAAGYDVLVKAVERLSEKVALQGETISYLEGRFASLSEKASSTKYKAEDKLYAFDPSTSSTPPSPPEPLEPTRHHSKSDQKTVFKRDLPKSIDGALRLKQDNAINF